VSFDPLSRALLDALRSLDARIADIEGRLERVEVNGNELLTPKQAAQLRGCSPAAIRAKVRRGQLPAVYEGRAMYIRRGDLEPPLH
jgi:hypothetical protein